MGPTNVALVNLFQADQQLRVAQGRLDAVTKNVRLQERRIKELTEQHKLALAKLRENQTQSAQHDLDLKSRDAHIEKLRTQQQNAKNNKEYQTFLVEINTEKVDKAKIEELALTAMQAVETGQKEVAELGATLEAEQAKLAKLREEIGGKMSAVQAEIDSLRPARDAAAAAVPQKARDAFERLADHHEGEAMSALSKPDRRREEYFCTACSMDLVTDVYNKLHARDELVFCPSCRRILYIPDDLPPEIAIKIRKTQPLAADAETQADPSVST
jgi:predicted  nucleic acid-binding Zn-ribbon protein